MGHGSLLHSFLRVLGIITEALTMSRFVVPCEFSWAGEPPPRAPATKEKALARIDEVYNSGKPFFTKEAIREIYEQLQQPPVRGDKVLGKDIITGEAVVFEIETGKIWRSRRMGSDVWVERVL